MIFTNFCKENDIKRTFALAYNPTANAISERLNQTLKNYLWILRQDPLSVIRDKIEFALNCSAHRTLGKSPFEILHSFSPFDPLTRNSEINLDLIRERITILGQKELKRKNLKRNTKISHGLDNFVYIKNLSNNKLENPWLDPFRICGLKANGNALQIDQGSKTCWVNIKQTKPAFDYVEASRNKERQDVVPNHNISFV